jgi:amylosucrase
VFALAREHAGDRLLIVANFTAEAQRVALAAPDEAAEVDGRPLERDGNVIVLAPYQHLWIRQ